MEENTIFDVAEVDGWLLMGNPITVFTIVLAYLLCVLKIGPEFMKDKEPYNIKGVIAVYNLYQTIYNAFIVAKVFLISGAITYIWNCITCQPVEKVIRNEYERHFSICTWYYLMSKVADLLDTIFFVLRKKQSHVTFLHVYHHAMMVISIWVFLKYGKGTQFAIIGILNSFVHIVMYSYYFLSTFGPSVQKYLWWKKYITKMQMIQFVIMVVYVITLQIMQRLMQCNESNFTNYYIAMQATIFLILFYKFYKKAYDSSIEKKK